MIQFYTRRQKSTTPGQGTRLQGVVGRVPSRGGTFGVRYKQNNNPLFLSRGPFLQPINIRVFGRGWAEGEMKIVPVIGLGPWIQPFLDLGMPVCKIETTSAVVIAGGKVNDRPRTRGVWIKAFHLRDKIAVVDAVVPLIQQDK